MLLQQLMPPLPLRPCVVLFLVQIVFMSLPINRDLRPLIVVAMPKLPADTVGHVVQMEGVPQAWPAPTRLCKGSKTTSCVKPRLRSVFAL